jgi:hypothetical protein
MAKVNLSGMTVEATLGVIIGGVTIALLVIGFFVWNSRQRNERLAVGLSLKSLLEGCYPLSHSSRGLRIYGFGLAYPGLAQPVFPLDE